MQHDCDMPTHEPKAKHLFIQGQSNETQTCGNGKMLLDGPVGKRTNLSCPPIYPTPAKSSHTGENDLTQYLPKQRYPASTRLQHEICEVPLVLTN